MHTGGRSLKERVDRYVRFGVLFKPTNFISPTEVPLRGGTASRAAEATLTDLVDSLFATSGVPTGRGTLDGSALS